MAYVLCLDIGGTNPRMAMIEVLRDAQFKILAKDDVKKEDKSVIPSINRFLETCAEQGISTEVCCAGVAGPIEGNACPQLTNIDMPVYGDEIIEKTPLKHVLVINDFEAIAHAVSAIDIPTALQKKSIIEISDHRTPSDGNRAITGCGTGFGLTFLWKQENGYVITATEGGNATIPYQHSFAPLFDFIREKTNCDRVDIESLASGQGIANIMEYVIKHPEFMEKIDVSTKENTDFCSLDPAEIAAHADKDRKAAVTMNIFIRTVADTAANVALCGLTTGGLFLVGGILPKNKALLMDGTFMKIFNTHFREDIKDILEKTPVYLVDDYDISFYGCARAALEKFKEKIK